MEYKEFGRTGLKVSRLGFGGIPIQRVTQAEANDILAACVDQGVNFFDTARGYGDSEEKLGIALAGKRQGIILASKSPQRDGIGFRRDLETCLKLLRTDYIDLYQLHMVSAPEVWEQVTAPKGALHALQQAQQEGLVRFVGVSSHSNDMLMKMVSTELFDSIQFPFNVVEQQFLPSLKRALELNIGTIAMKPLAGGSYVRSDLALRFIAQSGTHTMISGMDKLEQVVANVAAVTAGPLEAQEVAILAEEAKLLGEDFCRRCDYCKPCPVDIPISSIFILEGYVSRYGLASWARERYKGLTAHGNDCTQCGLCESRCPYTLAIRDKLAKAHEALQDT